MKRKQKIMLLLLILSIFVIINVLAFQSEREIKEINYSFIVDNEVIGFDIDTNQVSFGKLLPHTEAKRDLLITNNSNSFVETTILFFGTGSEWLSAQTQMIAPKEQAIISIILKVPQNALEGMYEGNIKLILTKK